MLKAVPLRIDIRDGVISDTPTELIWQAVSVPNRFSVEFTDELLDDELARQIQAYPTRFTPWLKTVWDDYRSCVSGACIHLVTR